MNKAIKKPIEIQWMTFNEFVEYGLSHTTNIVDGYPWSFDFKGVPITHESNECYLLPTLEGTMRFTTDDVLMIGVNDEIYPCKISIFEKTYDIIK